MGKCDGVKMTKCSDTQRSPAARFILTELGLIVVTLMTVALPLSGKEIDVSNWIDQRIAIVPLELTFIVPPGRAEAYGKPAVLSDARLDRDPAEPRRAVPLFHHTWSYDRSFWRGTMGSLQMVVALERGGSDPLLGAEGLLNLEKMIRHNLEEHYVPHAAAVRLRGRDDLVVSLPPSYIHITMAGREWLMYKLGGWKDQTFYATPLSDDKYLTISFDFIDNTRGYKSGWREEAQAVVDSITRSIRIRSQ